MRDYFVNRALEVDPREGKLPAWARDKLADMRRATTEATEQLDALKAGTKPSAFWLESWDDAKKFYLPECAGRLMFKSGNVTLQLSAERGGAEFDWLNIQGGSSGILARPHASNVLLVRNIID